MDQSASAKSGPGIIGAAIVLHAPQFLTLPETDDTAQIAPVNAAMHEIGDRFRALDPDLGVRQRVCPAATDARALFRLRLGAGASAGADWPARAAFRRDPASYAARVDLGEGERAALIAR